MDPVDLNAKIIWDYMLVHDKLAPTDVIICLGSHDTNVARRAAELYLAKMAPKIIITGGRGKITVDSPQTESDTYMAIMVAAGVLEDDIIVEDKATNTGENATLTYKLVSDIHMDIQNAIIVTKPYMERRAKATFAKLWPELTTMVTSQDISYEEYMNSSPLGKEKSIEIMVGDLQRIIEYPAKGWMAPSEVPDEVMTAYKQLIF